MKDICINLRDTIQSTYCVDSLDGEKVYLMLKKILSDGQAAQLSFKGIELVIAAFLNVAVGQLFKDFESDYVHSHLSAQDLHNDYQTLWAKTMHHTPHYYHHREDMDQCISKIIEE